MMSEMRSPEQLRVSELLPEACKEIHAYLHQPTTNANVYAFELFRRAIGRRDEQAWCCLYELYHGVAGSWLLRRLPSLPKEDGEVLVNEAFAKFFRSIGPEHLKNFLSVGALLAYLKCCTGSVLADYCRSQRVRACEDSLEAVTQEPIMLDDFAPSVVERLAAQEVWAVLSCAVPAQEERLILVLVCALGLAPRELHQRYPDLYSSVQDVYRIKRSVLEHLRRNTALHGLVGRQPPSQPREVRATRHLTRERTAAARNASTVLQADEVLG